MKFARYHNMAAMFPTFALVKKAVINIPQNIKDQVKIQCQTNNTLYSVLGNIEDYSTAAISNDIIVKMTR